ncbi:MAG TPA: hypothetical protein VL463_11785 [Kofleriaceae bacterium]|jgi:hypothetical protein|nr:hypothetical protein [Kofleriaceae bacterium]
MEDRRPPRLVRAFVLVFAIACLGLAMCAHSAKPPAPANASTATPDAGAREYFPATKAAGPIYPQQQGD